MPTIQRLSTIRREKPSIREKSPDQIRKATYYNNRQWKLLRQTYYQNHPLDEVAQVCGCVQIAQHVHHLIKFED